MSSSYDLQQDFGYMLGGLLASLLVALGIEGGSYIVRKQTEKSSMTPDLVISDPDDIQIQQEAMSLTMNEELMDRVPVDMSAYETIKVFNANIQDADSTLRLNLINTPVYTQSFIGEVAKQLVSWVRYELCSDPCFNSMNNENQKQINIDDFTYDIPKSLLIAVLSNVKMRLLEEGDPGDII
jgi:hypothetical protein